MGNLSEIACLIQRVHVPKPGGANRGEGRSRCPGDEGGAKPRGLLGLRNVYFPVRVPLGLPGWLIIWSSVPLIPWLHVVVACVEVDEVIVRLSCALLPLVSLEFVVFLCVQLEACICSPNLCAYGSVVAICVACAFTDLFLFVLLTRAVCI